MLYLTFHFTTVLKSSTQHVFDVVSYVLATQTKKLQLDNLDQKYHEFFEKIRIKLTMVAPLET